MKKVFAIAFACVALLALTSCSKKDNSADNSTKAIQERGTFILGLDDSFPPLGFRNDANEIVGYDIDLATEVCSRLGVKLVCQPIDWSAKEQELATGNIDCIWNGFTMTPEREEAMSFSKAYLDNAQVVIVRIDSGIKTLKDLEGKVIGLQAGSSAAEAVDSLPDFKNSVKEIVEFKDNLTALMDLEIGGIDGVVMDIVVGSYNINTSNKEFIILPEHLVSEQYGIGFRKSDVALRDSVQETLEAMAKDGTVAKISEKWFGTDISVIGK